MRTSSAPPFLLAAALLFWSAMTDQWLVGMTLAVIVELAHWARIRWDFADAAFLRAWHLSILLVAARMVLTVLEGSLTTVIQQIVTWGPALFLPVQFAQSYGLRRKIPLYIFSILARKRWERNRALGVGGKPAEVCFDYVYLGITLLAAAMGKSDAAKSIGMLLGGFILITAWAVLTLGNRRRLAILASLAVAGGISVGGMITLKVLYRKAIYARSGANDDMVNHTDTAIGALGELKKSREILWRMKALQGPTPPLLHLSTYNQYISGTSSWTWRPTDGKRTMEILLNQEPTPEHVFYFASQDRHGPEAMADSLPRIRLRGAAKEQMLLPVPGNLASLTGFEFDYVERNPLGTFRAEPREPIIDGVMLWDPAVSSDAPPDKIIDLKVPDQDAAAAHATATQLDLAKRPLSEKLRALANHFSGQFRYTRYLSGESPLPIDKGPSPITQFLTTKRVGHCEYFATAATLILRDAGIPVRYAVGYSVQELDLVHKEAVIRGMHAHAWCRVWDAERKSWIDFDPTPPDWFSHEPDRDTWVQIAKDWIQRLREDFFIWRNNPDNTFLLAGAMGLFGLLGGGAIARNLWKSRHRIEKGPASVRSGIPTVRTPLHFLEPVARKILGPRPIGMTYPRWLEGLKSHLPDPAILSEAIGLHQQLRFDSQLPENELSERLESLEKTLKAALKSRRERMR
ncbi:MAG: transglutaminase-like domain-containing protein [Luteolibacter sp.]